MTTTMTAKTSITGMLGFAIILMLFGLTAGCSGSSEQPAKLVSILVTPSTPTIRYSGPAGFPASQLTFEVSASADVQGGNGLTAIQWRVGEITAPDPGAHDSTQPRRYEIEPRWTSDELSASKTQMRIPKEICAAGHTYRVRARSRDNDGRWSHWSTPVQLTAAK